jgi:hypothetical protein
VLTGHRLEAGATGLKAAGDPREAGMEEAVKQARLPQSAGRGRPRRSRWRRWLLRLLALGVLAAIAAVLYNVWEEYPLESLVIAAIFLLAAIGVALYVGELVVLGWVVDLLIWLAAPTLHRKETPLECQRVGEIVIVKLGDIVTVWQCESVRKQLQRLIDEQHCDLILDFSGIGRISSHFRGVMLRLARAARREAGKLGKPYRPVALPPGEVFRVFDDRASALEAMGIHAGHGWVVLCSVPAGIRAVSTAT